MKRVVTLASALLVAGCGIGPSGVTEQGGAPAGVAPGVTLYLVDGRHHLVPQQRATGQLGTTAEALALLLSASDDGGPLHTEIRNVSVTRVSVQITPGRIVLQVPLTGADVTAAGADQIVCTAVASVVQTGAARTTRVVIRFTDTPAEALPEPRTCPVIG